MFRPVTSDDLTGIHQLVAASERDLDGEVDTTPDRLTGALLRPTLDLARDTRLILTDGELAGWAMVHLGTRATIHVHPGHRSRGHGTRLLDWAEQRAAEHGSTRLAQTVSDHDAAALALLQPRGYATIATNWLLKIGLDTEPAVPAPPDGIVVRMFRPSDERAVYDLITEAFGEWSQRRHDYPEWAAGTVQRETFSPDLSPLAYAGERLVGAVLSMDVPGHADGHVEEVAVDRAYRGRGIARLLLRHAFHGAYRQGRRRCRLWTHSGTGALPLYERVGMAVRRSNTVHRRDL